MSFAYNLVSALEEEAFPSLEFLLGQKWLTEMTSNHKFINSCELGLLCKSFPVVQ